jgi:DNA repair protein RadC
MDRKKRTIPAEGNESGMDKSKEENLNAGHRERLRGKFLANPDTLHDHELLELILTYAIPRRDCKTLAKRLIKRFGGLDDTIDANPDDLRQTEGFGDSSLALIKAIAELEARREYERMIATDKGRISSPSDAVAFARAKIAGRKDEAFLVILLDTKNKIRGYSIEQEGTVNQAVVYPRKIIESALRLGASGVILVHNHPSGETAPSSHDIRLTEEIAKAAKPMDITVLDHIIVGKKESFSFKDEGLI